MLKKYLVVLLVACTGATADGVEPYVFGDLGFANTDNDTTLAFGAGFGFAVLDNLEFELGYNDFGEGDDFDVQTTSVSLAANWGTVLSNGIFVHTIFGIEELETTADVFGFDFETSDTRGFFGVGATNRVNDNVSVRARLTSRAEGELLVGAVSIQLSF